MGSYFNFYTRIPSKVNELWRKVMEPGDFNSIVYSKEVIENDLKIFTTEDCKQYGLKNKTIEEWNRTFTICRLGFGQLKLSCGELTDEEIKVVNFVYDNANLFLYIEDQSDQFPFSKEVPLIDKRTNRFWQLYNKLEEYQIYTGTLGKSGTLSETYVFSPKGKIEYPYEHFEQLTNAKLKLGYEKVKELC